MKNEKRVKILTVGTILSIAYVVFALYMYFTTMNDAVNDSAGAVIGASLASIFIVPHLIVAVIGVVFNIIGFMNLNTGFILTSAILYSVACALCIFWAFLLVPGMIIMYVAYSKQKKVNKNI